MSTPTAPFSVGAWLVWMVWLVCWCMVYMDHVVVWGRFDDSLSHFALHWVMLNSSGEAAEAGKVAEQYLALKRNRQTDKRRALHRQKLTATISYFPSVPVIT